MEGVKNIILDLGGVILNTNTDETLEAFKQMVRPGIEIDYEWEHLPRIIDNLETGKWNKRAFIRFMKPFMRENIDKRQIIDAWCAMLEDFPVKRIKMLKELGEKYNLYLYSNTDIIHIDAFEQDFKYRYGYPLSNLFLKVYYSSDIGLRKPGVDGFQMIIDENGLNPEETLFIDDRKENCEAAKQIGLQAVSIPFQSGLEYATDHL